MSQSVIEQPHATNSLVLVATWCTIAAAVLQIPAGPMASQITAGSAAYTWVAVIGTFDHLLMLVGMAGLARSGALGAGWLARGGTALSMVGFAALAVAEPVFVVSKIAANPLFGFGTLGVAAGLTLSGVAALRTRRWSGWHRFTPVLTGLFLAFVVTPSFALPGRDFTYALSVWGICFLLLGLAMRAEAKR